MTDEDDDDDLTVPGDHELIAELRKSAASAGEPEVDDDDDETVGADSDIVSQIRHLGPLPPPTFSALPPPVAESAPTVPVEPVEPVAPSEPAATEPVPTQTVRWEPKGRLPVVQRPSEPIADDDEGPSRGWVIGGAVAAAVAIIALVAVLLLRDGDDEEVPVASTQVPSPPTSEPAETSAPETTDARDDDVVVIDHQHHHVDDDHDHHPSDHDCRADNGRAVRKPPVHIELDDDDTTPTENTEVLAELLARSTTALTVVDWGVATTPGTRRRVNEDAWSRRPDVYVIADGMGGRGGGALAARTAIDRFLQAAPGTDQLRDAVATINDEVVREATNWGFEHVGTTLLAAVLGGPVVTVVHVGDSRAVPAVRRALRPAHRRPQRAWRAARGRPRHRRVP